MNDTAATVKQTFPFSDCVDVCFAHHRLQAGLSRSQNSRMPDLSEDIYKFTNNNVCQHIQLAFHSKWKLLPS